MVTETSKGLKIFTLVIALIPLLFYVDSRQVAQTFPYNQWLANAMMLALFVAIYLGAANRLRRLMWYGILVAAFGEVLFSLVLGMYEYRLFNVPIYVPLGHSVIYAAVYYFSRESWFKNNAHLQQSMLAVSVLYSALWWWQANDGFGFVCLLGFLFFLSRARTEARPFFIVMFVVVAYLEQLGTYFECWYWPAIWFGEFAWMPSGNPPSGIALFYFAFDLGCLWLYKKFHFRTWLRMRRIYPRVVRA